MSGTFASLKALEVGQSVSACGCDAPGNIALSLGACRDRPDWVLDLGQFRGSVEHAEVS